MSPQVLRQDQLAPSPYLKSNIISKLFFWWLNPLFSAGSKKSLDLSDLYQTLPSDRSKTLGDTMDSLWSAELKRCAKRNKPSFRRVIIKQFGSYFVWVGMLAFVEECVTRIAQPLLLGHLIRYFSTTPPTSSKTEGYLFATGVVFCSAFYTFTHHPYFFGVQYVGMKIRIAACSVIYRKSLRLSQSSLGQTTIGQLVNLLSNDVNRFDQSTIFLHYLWIGPIQTGIITAILWTYYGAACFAGLAVLVLFVPFQAYMGRLFSNLRTATASKTDTRIRIMNEIVSGMRIIKMYAWERPFSGLVAGARGDEVQMIRKTSNLRAINMSLFYTSSKIIIFLTLLTYVLSGNYLTAEKVFVTLSLYNNVRLIMTLFFPTGISQLAEVLVSVRRIQDFLLMDERSSIPPKYDLTFNSKPPPPLPQIGIKLDNLCAEWTPEHQTLTDISLTVGDKELVAVIGHVGSGKTSLLQTLLSELPPTSGTLKVTGTIAYTSQEPWVFAGSVKDNILFGRQMDENWYNQVLEACALVRDLELFPHADNTLVGDRGASLSGGQKARITLARAVYADADVYLLDDPISAVDAEVGLHLFSHCICGLLKNKTRILVTHQIQLLQSVQHIILLSERGIKTEGDYEHLFKGITEIKQYYGKSPSVISRNRTVSTISDTSNTSYPHTHRRRSSSIVATLDGSFTGNTFGYDEFEEESPDEYEDDESTISKQTQESDNHEVLLNKRRKSRSVPKVNEEGSSTGSVRIGLLFSYFKAGSNWCSGGVLILSNVMTQVLCTGCDWWLNVWTRSEEEKKDSLDHRGQSTNRTTQIYVYSGIIGALFIASLIRTLVFFNICMTASVNLHESMFSGVLRAPMRFFEVNPVGRILNRITKDIGCIDETMPPTLFDTMEIFLNVLGILVIVGLINPILLTPAIVLSVFFYFLRRFYLQTARSVKRIEGIARSPVFSHLSTSLYGLTTIRAFRTESDFIKQFDDFQDMHTSAWYLFIATTRWFGIWLDWISVSFIAFVTFSFMVSAQGGAHVGLAVSSVMMLTGMLQWGVRQSAEVENQMVSVERVLEYTKLEPEAALETPAGQQCPSKEWPTSGKIVLTHVQLRYGPGEPVLNDITCTIKANEKVGIVGRTGAGKSSLIAALFRLSEPTGSIQIDGIDVLKIGLHDLRSKISIIPQDPVLFTGTLRKNLDPFNVYTDAHLWSVLEDVQLAHDFRQSASGLDVEVSESGANFSVGQRQLVCLARAILKNNKILVLDEATANVDPDTDGLIQQTIRTKFSNCTVLTVAHRLHTVMDCDRILVLDTGSVLEFDEPYTLLQNSESALYKLVEQTGAAENLLAIAKEAAVKRRLSVRTILVEEDVPK